MIAMAGVASAKLLWSAASDARRRRFGGDDAPWAEGSLGTHATSTGGDRYGTPSPGLTPPASTPGYSGPVHDEVYKRLFAFPRMVEDLLRGFVGGEWIDDIDFSTLRKLSAEYIGEELRRRHGDTVWRVHRREDGLPLLVLLEFQSTADPDMALRVLEYTALLYRELKRNEALGPEGKRPAVLPVVLYNGESPWTAAVEVGRADHPGGADAGALSALAALLGA